MAWPNPMAPCRPGWMISVAMKPRRSAITTHGSTKYPYVNGGFHGEVVEAGDQVDPQPRAQPVPAGPAAFCEVPRSPVSKPPPMEGHAFSITVWAAKRAP